MVQNMRAYFILNVITIKCINCMQEKTEFSCKLQRPTLISTKTLGDLSLATKIKQQKNNKKLQENSQGRQKDGILLPRGAVATPMPPHGYGPALKGPPSEAFKRHAFCIIKK